MNLSAQHLSYIVILAPLLASIITGFFGKILGKNHSHRTAIALLGLAFLASIVLCRQITLLWCASSNI